MNDDLFTIETTRFGPLTLDGSRVVEFRETPPGLTSFKQVVILEAVGTEPFHEVEPDDVVAFCWLQSVTDPAQAVLAVSPWAVEPEYEFEFDDTMLGSPRPEELSVLSIVAINDDIPTANLRAPVLINLSNRTARQVILPDDRWPVQAAMGV